MTRRRINVNQATVKQAYYETSCLRLRRPRHALLQPETDFTKDRQGSWKLNIRLTQMTDYLISFGTMIRSMR